MTRLKTMQAKVEDILERFQTTRDDDRQLIGCIYKFYYDVDMSMPFREILLRDDLPSFETIRRCRQKAQEEHEELRGSTYARNQRKVMEGEVRAYVQDTCSSDEIKGQQGWRLS